MRSYDEYCALAKSLDVVGDRWTLLIVRELELRGACRYTDLRNGLPGIATNLLADRLRELEAAGLVAREEAPPPVATTLFQLTERGNVRDLMPRVEEGPDLAVIDPGVGGVVHDRAHDDAQPPALLYSGYTDSPVILPRVSNSSRAFAAMAGRS